MRLFCLKILPVHQGRAAEHLLAKTFVKPGHIVPMNYHFTTTKAHFDMAGGKVLELYTAEALKAQSAFPFKRNMDLGRLRAAIEKAGPENVSFVRMEATTNLIGGQPFSLENMKQVKALIEPMGIFLVLDASLISENAYFIRQREPGYEKASIRDIILEMMSVADLCYLSGRKSCSGRDGAQPFAHAMYGAPLIVNAERTGGPYCCYRWHGDNPVTFERYLKHTMEHGHANNRGDNFFSTAYWYQSAPYTDFPALPPVAARIPQVKTV